MKPTSSRPAPSECPVCGADVPPHARACPECGADERTGWDDEATRYDGIDLPEDAFASSDNQSIRPARRPSSTGVDMCWRLVALALVIMTIIGLFLTLRLT